MACQFTIYNFFFPFYVKIYALKAEALLKLHRHQEADEVLLKGPNFNVDDSTKYFGPIANANVLVVRAQVDIAAGRLVISHS